MITIRFVRPTEVSTLQDLNQEVFTDNAKYDPDIILDWAYSEVGRKYFEDLVQDPASICFVAETENGELVGYIAASPKSFSYRKSKYIEVDNMGVLPEYRSQGVGKMLMEFCLAEAKNRGYQRAFVDCYFKNEKALAFYKKNGYHEMATSLEQEL